MDIFQRNSMALGAPQVAPFISAQYGLPRPEFSQLNSAGGLPLPNLGTAPVPPSEIYLTGKELGSLLGQPAGRSRVPMFGNLFGELEQKGLWQRPLGF